MKGAWGSVVSEVVGGGLLVGVVGTSRVDSISGLRVVRFCGGSNGFELLRWVEWLSGL